MLEEAEPHGDFPPQPFSARRPGGGLSPAPSLDRKQLAEGSPACSLITSHLDPEPQELRPKSALSAQVLPTSAISAPKNF